MTQRQSIQKYAISAIENHADEPITGPKLQRILEEEFAIERDEKKCAQVLQRLYSTEVMKGMERVSRGTYVFSPEKANGKALFTELGQSKDGTWVLEREDGTLFRAEEL